MQGVELDFTDIDLVPELSSDNVRALARALVELGIDQGHGTSREVIAFMLEKPEFIRAADVWTVLTSHGEVDVTLRPDGFPNGYIDLVDEDVGRDEESKILVASLEDIRRSKEIAGRDKDVAALRMFPRDRRVKPLRPLPPRPHRDEEALRLRDTGRGS